MPPSDSGPQWADGLFPHIRLTAYQVERLELVRTHAALRHDELHFHIQSHPECTKMLQRELFQSIRRDNPGMPDELALVLVIWTRFLTARVSGGDLFGLGRFPLVDPNEPPEELVVAIVGLLRSRSISTIDHLAQAIVDEEAYLPNTATAPDLEHVADQVTRILSEAQRG